GRERGICGVFYANAGSGRITRFMRLTRRQFLTRVAHAGVYSATFAAMQSLGLLASPPSSASAVDLPADAGKGLKVLVLGGGIGGVRLAYELGGGGVPCTLLRAGRPRAGEELSRHQRRKTPAVCEGDRKHDN